MLGCGETEARTMECRLATSLAGFSLSTSSISYSRCISETERLCDRRQVTGGSLSCFMQPPLRSNPSRNRWLWIFRASNGLLRHRTRYSWPSSVLPLHYSGFFSSSIVRYPGISMPELGTIYDYMRAHAALLGRATRRVEPQ